MPKEIEHDGETYEVVDETPEPEEKEPSLRETLEAAIEEPESLEEDQVTEEAEGITQESSSEEDTTQISDQTGEVSEDETPEMEPLEPPTSWSQDARSHWSSLPRQAQEYVLTRERDIVADHTRKTQEAAEVRRRYEQLDQVLSPYKDEWALQRQTPAQVVDSLLAADRFLKQDPHGAIQWLAQQHGVDPQQLADPGAYAVPPHVQQLNAQVHELKSTIDQQQAERQRQVLEAKTQEVETFYDQKSPQGEEMFPHWRDVTSHIEALLPTLMQTNPGTPQGDLLKTAYDQAVYANPATRTKILERQQKQAFEKEKEQIKAKAIKAKRAAGSVRGAAGTKLEQDIPDTVRGAIEQAFTGL